MEKSLPPFSHFFDLMGEELLAAVEESRSKGIIVGALNATFITLIPKSDKPSSFSDFRPISLYNLIYKVIAKIIANRLNPVLSRCITQEKFGFLEDRQITDVVGIAQEVLHSVK
jgi:hypothetical protein